MAVLQKAWLASASAQLEVDFPTVSSGALLKVLRQQMSKGAIKGHVQRKRLLPAPETPLPPMACLLFPASLPPKPGKLRSLALPLFPWPHPTQLTYLGASRIY